MSIPRTFAPANPNRPIALDNRSAVTRQLRRSHRFWHCDEGNRHNWAVAKAYWARVAGRDDLAEACVAYARKQPGIRQFADGEAERILASTSKIVATRWDICCSRAMTMTQGTGLHSNARMVLAQLMLYGFTSGVCSAAQGEIAQALGLSRKTVNQWVGVLRERGLIKVVDYDSVGSYMWKGRKYTKWCLVFAFARGFRGVTLMPIRRLQPRREAWSECPNTVLILRLLSLIIATTSRVYAGARASVAKALRRSRLVL